MEVERAIAEIEDIRTRMAAATRFRGYAPGGVGTIGLLSLAVTVMQLAWPTDFAANDRQIVLIWGAMMAIGLLLMGFEAAVRTRRAGGRDRMAPTMLLSTMRIVLPGAVVTAAVPAAVLSYAPDAAWIVPGIWQMLIGLVAFASYPSLPRTIVWPGAWFLISGAAGLFLAGRAGGLAALVTGAPFVMGYFGIAWVLIDREHSDRA